MGNGHSSKKRIQLYTGDEGVPLLKQDTNEAFLSQEKRQKKVPNRELNTPNIIAGN